MSKRGKWIKGLTKETDYRVAKISLALKGRIFSEETRRRMSEAAKKKIFSKEHRLKIGISLIGNKRSLGYKHTEETRKKMSEKGKGRKKGPFTKEHKDNISKAKMGKHVGAGNPMFGKKHSDETKEKIRFAILGKYKGKDSPLYGIPKSEEQKQKLRLAAKNNPYYGFGGKKHSLETRKKMSEISKGKIVSEETKEKLRQYIGEMTSNWQGGKSFEPYTCDFNKKFKKGIRKRDGCCLVCHLSEEDAKILTGKSLCVHHIDYNKKNSFPQNCVTLCTRCHLVTNRNRQHWKTFFQSMLKELYNYEYTQEQKIILDFTKRGI